MTAPVSPDPTSLTKNETVVVQHFLLWVVLNAGLWVTERTHLVTSAQVVEYAPYVTAAVLALAAKLLRNRVAPAWKVPPVTVASVQERLAAEVSPPEIPPVPLAAEAAAIYPLPVAVPSP